MVGELRQAMGEEGLREWLGQRNRLLRVGSGEAAASIAAIQVASLSELVLQDRDRQDV